MKIKFDKILSLFIKYIDTQINIKNKKLLKIYIKMIENLIENECKYE